jgi:hypothetical protein
MNSVNSLAVDCQEPGWGFNLMSYLRSQAEVVLLNFDLAAVDLWRFCQQLAAENSMEMTVDTAPKPPVSAKQPILFSAREASPRTLWFFWFASFTGSRVTAEILALAIAINWSIVRHAEVEEQGLTHAIN